MKQLPSALNVLMFATSGWTGEEGEGQGEVEKVGERVAGRGGREDSEKPQPSADRPALLVPR